MILFQKFGTVDLDNDLDFDSKVFVEVEQNVQHITGMGDIDLLVLDCYHFLGKIVDIKVGTHKVIDCCLGWF